MGSLLVPVLPESNLYLVEPVTSLCDRELNLMRKRWKIWQIFGADSNTFHQTDANSKLHDYAVAKQERNCASLTQNFIFWSSAPRHRRRSSTLSAPKQHPILQSSSEINLQLLQTRIQISGPEKGADHFSGKGRKAVTPCVAVCLELYRTKLWYFVLLFNVFL